MITFKDTLWLKFEWGFDQHVSSWLWIWSLYIFWAKWYWQS